MEIPDVIVVNKADHPLTDTMVREIRGVLSLAPAAAGLARADRQDGGRPRRGGGGAGRAARGAPGVRRGGGPPGRAPPAQPPRTRCSGWPRMRLRRALEASVAGRSGGPGAARRRRRPPAGPGHGGAARARARGLPRHRLPTMPSPETPLQGACACGTVRFQVTAPFELRRLLPLPRAAGGAPGRCGRTNATLDADGCRGRRGRGGAPDVAAAGRASPSRSARECGGHVFSGDPGPRAARSACAWAPLRGDPGIEPSWRQWLESAPGWFPIPDDGLARFARSRHDACGAAPVSAEEQRRPPRPAVAGAVDRRDRERRGQRRARAAAAAGCAAGGRSRTVTCRRAARCTVAAREPPGLPAHAPASPPRREPPGERQRHPARLVHPEA